jgi:hypothetical protein
MHHLLSAHIITAILFSHLPSLATATALPRSSPPALTANTRTQCTTSPAWLTPTFRPEDCLEAVERFLYTDYIHYKGTRYEFHDRTPPPQPRYPPMLVPRRYTIASCTVVIAMLWDFPDLPPLPPLPGDPKGPFQRADVLSFQDVFNALRRVSLRCYGDAGDLARGLGWEAVGKDFSVGVFMMATGSEVERNIRIGVEPSGTVAGGSLNSTGVVGGGAEVQTS